MSDETQLDQDSLHSLCEEASSLVGRLPGRPSRVKITAGDYKVELEWEVTPAGPPVAYAPAAYAAAPAAGDVAGGAEPAVDDRHAIVAVLVGTFYRSSEPGAPPFVEVGDTVEEGQEVAIIEAMKVMNRIQADRAGRVAEILVESGEMVEFEQRLIVLEPTDAS